MPKKNCNKTLIETKIRLIKTINEKYFFKSSNLINKLNPRQNIKFLTNPSKARDDRLIFTESITFIKIINRKINVKIKFLKF